MHHDPSDSKRIVAGEEEVNERLRQLAAKHGVTLIILEHEPNVQKWLANKFLFYDSRNWNFPCNTADTSANKVVT